MADVLSKEQRRRNMQRIKARNTGLEMAIRSGLHRRGLRYKLHDDKLPGCPDLVFRSARVAVFVHGCFWHQHGCSLSSTPATRKDFWIAKFKQNAARDSGAIERLRAEDWRVLVIRECSIRKTDNQRRGKILDLAASFIRNENEGFLDIDSTIFERFDSTLAKDRTSG